MQIQYDRGVYLPELKLWLDPSSRKLKETGFVSHAHSDHARWHGTTLLSRQTLRLMRQRDRGGEGAKIQTPAFLETLEFNGANLTLYPAGHMAGSAQLLVDYGGQRLLYSGDFKLRPDPCAEPIAVPRADLLVMETTFGRPEYLFPPISQTMEKVARFCGQALDDKMVPVLLVYSMGKAQEVIKSLQPWGFEFVLHPSAAGITEIYRAMGYTFGPCHVMENQSPEGRVVIWPPLGRQNQAWLALRNKRVAFLSGWAMDRSARFRFGADEIFPVSDHADYSELLAYVQQVKPKKIYTLHGFAADFAASLRRLGHDARALGEEEQLELL